MILSLPMLALHAAGVWIVLSSTVIGLAAARAGRWASRLRLTRQKVAPRLPMSLRWRRGHSTWQAARAAELSGRSEAALRLWTQLAGDERAHGQIRGLAHAMLADLALDTAAWEEAVRLVGRRRRLDATTVVRRIPRPHRRIDVLGVTVFGEEQRGSVRRRDLLGGLLHEYQRAA